MSYQDDIAAALQQARWDAFRSGAFCRHPARPAGTLDDRAEICGLGRGGNQDERPDDPETWTAGGEAYRWEWQAAQVDVCDPDSLLRAQPFSLTHSVIDMTHVADQPEYAAVPSPTD